MNVATGLALVWEIDPGDPRRHARATEVLVSSSEVPFPPLCPACLGPATTIVEVSYEASVRGNRRCCRVPHCAACAAEIARRARRVGVGFASAFVAQLAVAWLTGALAMRFAMAADPLPGLVVATKALPTAVAPVVLRWIWLAYRRCWYLGVRIVGADPVGTRVHLAIDEPAYVAELLRLDPTARVVARRGPARPSR